MHLNRNLTRKKQEREREITQRDAIEKEKERQNPRFSHAELFSTLKKSFLSRENLMKKLINELA